MTTPLKYTGPRLIAYKNLVVATRLRGPEREAVIEELNKRERRAIRYAAKTAAVRAEREAAKEAKKEATRLARNQRRREKRAAEKATYSVTFVLKYRARPKDSEWREFKETETLTVKGDINKAVRERVEQMLDLLESTSPMDYDRAGATFEIVKKEMVMAKKHNVLESKMKDAGALPLDGQEPQDWDTKKGECVFDYLTHRYGARKGAVELVRKLDDIFRTYEAELPDGTWETRKCENPREEGVNAWQILKFAKLARIPYYVLDDTDKKVYEYMPTVQATALPSLAIRVANRHLYVITDATRVMSIAQTGKATSKSVLDYKAKTKEKRENDKDAVVEIRMIEPVETTDGDARIAAMLKIQEEKQLQVFPHTNMMFGRGGKLRAFTLDGVRYVFDEDGHTEACMKIAELNGRPYRGELPSTLVSKMMDDLKIEKGVCNPAVYASLVTESVKELAHVGLTYGDMTREELKTMEDAGEGFGADIRRCHTACVEAPMDAWILPTFGDEWQDYDGALTTGLYYVKTNDTTLFKLSGIYDSKTVELAIAEGIPHEVLRQLKPRKTLPMDYFKPLLEKIHEECKGNDALKKLLTNTAVGLLGKDKTRKYKPHITTDPDVALDWFSNNENPTMISQGGMYISTAESRIAYSEMNVAMYLQIKCWANIRLYKMIKESGGECLYRKVDYAFIRGGSLKYGNKNGDYRPSELPATCGPMRESNYRHVPVTLTLNSSWNTVGTITDSDQYADVFALLERTRGLLNVSRAGTGKTYAALKVEELFLAKYPTGRVVKMAPTNKAAIVMRGQTIHRALQMDAMGNMNLGVWSGVRAANVPTLFLIDEVSMITEMLWRRLAELKKYVGDNAYFMMSGDYRQLPPVEDDADVRDYFNSSVMKYMANNTRIEFVVRKRYDEALWNFAEEIDRRGYADVSKVREMESYDPAALSDKMLLCYTNKMRKSLNMRMNEFARPAGAVFVPHIEEGDKQQDAYVYVGLPVMAHANNKKMDVVNNESFVVESIDGDKMTLVAERPDGEHRVTCDVKAFHAYFVMAYASTIHKQQGATIDSDIVLFEWDRMDKRLRYTAVTRAKKLSQIIIHTE
jgi:hypothetical protein